MAQPTYSPFRWFLLATVTFGYVTAGLLVIMLAPILGDVARTYGIDVGQATVAAMASYIFASAVAVIASGPLIDRLGVRPSIVIGATIMVAGCLLAPVLATSVGGLVLTRVLMGIGAGPVSACVPAVAARWFPPQERGVFAGAQGSGMALGVALGFVVVPQAVSANAGDWRAAIAWLAIIPAIGLLLCLATFLRPEPAGDADHGGAGGGEFGRVLREPSFYLGAGAMFVFVWIMNVFNQQTPAYFAEPAPLGLALGAVVAGQKMLFVQAGMILGGVASGVLLDKVLKGNARPVLVVGFVAAAAFMLSIRLPFVVSNAPVLAVCLLLAGFFESFTIPAVSAFVSLNYPQSVMGRVFALAFGVSLFGGAVGVGVAGAVLSSTGSYALPTLIVGVVALVGAALSAFLQKPTSFAPRRDAR